MAGQAGVCPNLCDFGDTIGSWAEAVLDSVPNGPLTLVGNSVGGSCAIEVAVRAPERVERPVAVVNGENDRPFRGRALAETAPLGEFHFVPGVGHYVPLEAPATLSRIIGWHKDPAG